jgi:very-short-patch-repair endonuclease
MSKENVEVQCHLCGKSKFVTQYKYNYNISKGSNFFCDKYCSNKWRAIEYNKNRTDKRKNTNCIYCNKEILKKAKTTKYCSTQCKGEHKKEINRVDVECSNCNKIFQKTKFHVNDSNNFCTKKCSSEWNSKQSKRVEMTCIICNKKYQVQNNRQDISKACSIKCNNTYKSTIWSVENVEFLRQNGVISSLNQSKDGTWCENVIENYLKSLNIKFEPQKNIDDKYIADFYIEDLNLIIEVYGDYWHSNPSIYGESENLKPLNDHQKKQVKKDNKKIGYYKFKKFSYLILWENDIGKNFDNIKEIIINKINGIRNDYRNI